MTVEEEMNNAELLKTGTCPFTGKPYDCARCDFHPHGEEGRKTLHFNLNITAPLTEGMTGWRRVLKWFDVTDRKEAKEEITAMLQMGATCYPVGDCDVSHFCFKHGCIGHSIKEEAAE